MYYVNKIVGFAVSPIGAAIACAIVAFVCARLRHPRTARWIGCLTVAWLWLWMTPVMTWVVGVPLEREFLVDGRVPQVESFPGADVIVLLGGGMGIETNLSSYAEMSLSADRVWQAARLYKAGKAGKIVATGDNSRDNTFGLLKDLGVAADDVSFVDARITEEEAKGVAKLGHRKILLVTSAWHMKRARLMFEKYAKGIEVVCAPTDFEQTVAAQNLFSVKALQPDGYVFHLNSVAFHEWVGIVGYKLFR
jgi:uncharacterized SAM-binding protein YcdF (DUF218 family)